MDKFDWEEIKNFLATSDEVMGWELKEHRSGDYFYDAGESKIWSFDWDPRNDLDDAWLCVQEYAVDMKIQTDFTYVSVSLNGNKCSARRNPAEAICLSILEDLPINVDRFAKEEESVE